MCFSRLVVFRVRFSTVNKIEAIFMLASCARATSKKQKDKAYSQLSTQLPDMYPTDEWKQILNFSFSSLSLFSLVGHNVLVRTLPTNNKNLTYEKKVATDQNKRPNE